MILKTGIKKTLPKGSYEVWFTIDNQTFTLHPFAEDSEKENKQRAKIYRKQLIHALKKLQK